MNGVTKLVVSVAEDALSSALATASLISSCQEIIRFAVDALVTASASLKCLNANAL